MISRQGIESQTKIVHDTAASKSKIAQSKKDLDKAGREFAEKSADLQRKTGEREKELKELADENNYSKE